MSKITWSPISAQMVNKSPNTFIVGTPGQGRKFYLDKNGNKIEDEVEDKVEEDE